MGKRAAREVWEYDSMGEFEADGGARTYGNGRVVINHVDHYCNNLKISAGLGLKPTGYDQSSEITQYLNDTGSSGLFADGDFIIGSNIVAYSSNINPETGGGYGLRMLGAGSAHTRFLDVRTSKTTSLFKITGQAAAARNVMLKMGGFSIFAATTAGIPLTGVATPLEGLAALQFEASFGSGFGATVTHMGDLDDVVIDGFVNGIILDDVTQFDFRKLWIQRAQRGVWFGGNCDLITFRHSGFGLEGGVVAMTAVESGYVGHLGSAGGGDALTFEHVWFMGIDRGYYAPPNIQESSVVFKPGYFERCKQYFVNSPGAGRVQVKFSDGTVFSMATTNDGSSSQPKIDLGNQVNAMCELDNVQGGPNPAGGWIKIGGTASRVKFTNCRLADGENGHIISDIAGQTRRVISLSDPSLNIPNMTFGGHFGCSKLEGEARTVQPAVQVGPTTYTIDYLKGDFFTITFSGALTLDIDIAATPIARPGTEITLQLNCSATPTSDSIVWPADWKIKFPYAFVQPAAGNVNHGTIVKIRKATSNTWIVVSPQNVWA